MTLFLYLAFVEVLCRVVGRAECRAVEIVEHEVHVFFFLYLQVVSDVSVTMNLDLDVSIGLSAKGSWFSKAALYLLVWISTGAWTAPHNSLHAP